MAGDPMILVLDYPGRRPEAHVSEMRLEQSGFDCAYMLKPPLPSALTARAYASQLCARLRSAQPLAVISYCATAPLAIAVAALMGDSCGGPPPIALLDPSRCHPSHIIRGYASVVRQIEGPAPISRPPLLDVEPMLATSDLLIQRIEADLWHRAKLSLAADGFEGAEAKGAMEAVIGMYVEWLTYLVAVHHCEQPTSSGHLFQVISREHPADVSWLGVAADRTVRIECDRRHLPKHPDARTLVLDFLHQVAARRLCHDGM